MLVLAFLGLSITDPASLGARDHIAQPRADGPAAQWAITDRQALAGKKALLAYLQVSHPAKQTSMSAMWSEGWRPKIWSGISSYHFLYEGVKISMKELGVGDQSKAAVRHVRITGLCDDIVKDASSVFTDTIVTDAGSCRFTAYFAPHWNRIVYFGVDGIA